MISWISILWYDAIILLFSNKKATWTSETQLVLLLTRICVEAYFIFGPLGCITTYLQYLRRYCEFVNFWSGPNFWGQGPCPWGHLGTSGDLGFFKSLNWISCFIQTQKIPCLWGGNSKENFNLGPIGPQNGPKLTRPKIIGVHNFFLRTPRLIIPTNERLRKYGWKLVPINCKFKYSCLPD